MTITAAAGRVTATDVITLNPVAAPCPWPQPGACGDVEQNFVRESDIDWADYDRLFGLSERGSRQPDRGDALKQQQRAASPVLSKRARR